MRKYRLRINCKFRDCLFLYRDMDNPTEVYCLHPEKRHHLDQVPCPLYHINWEKRLGQAEEMKAYLKNKKSTNSKDSSTLNAKSSRNTDGNEAEKGEKEEKE